MSHNLFNYPLIIGTFRSFPPCCYYEFYCRCLFKNFNLYLHLSLFIWMESQKQNQWVRGYEHFQLSSYLLPNCFHKVSCFCPRCVRILTHLSKQVTFVSSSDLLFIFLSASVSHWCIFPLGLGPSSLFYIISLMKMSIASNPTGEFYYFFPWLKSSPMREAKTLKWAVRETFWTDTSQCPSPHSQVGSP